MKAVCWNGKYDVRVETVPDPRLINPRDAIIKVTTTAICGSDLHLYDGIIPTMMPGDILGHEFMGEVVEVGAGVKNLQKGDRVVVPFAIACGNCFFCQRKQFSLCDNSNPNSAMTAKVYGDSPSGLFGYSHMMGGYDGGQAEYVRVPYADVGPLKIPDGVPDEKVVFLTDIFPTGYMAAENAAIEEGDTVAIWGCGPVGQFAIRSALMLGAAKVIAIDREPARLQMAERASPNVETVNFESHYSVEEILDRTGGRGADSCIDCVGTEAFGHGPGAILDYVKQLARLQSDRPNVLRQAMTACRKGGTISIPGVYGGIIDSINFGAAFNKGLTFKMGQTHVHRYLEPLMQRIQNGEIDPSFVITHHARLDEAPEMYKTFRNQKSECIKVVMKPG
ncbi:zinc-dependent alcohol dehydrogenase [Fimbriimonas ginsengisoli]|uniref:Threonine dehydrogenase-related Zn-dependent dehydrogenase n=1 Tax=Fimbriimonas ginsengisoli Gsoil 348 TaxID=661478 RepID=A0A068NS71_FIMGI|nr:zinc-dependent alcohol dehydrogenase [Fimbriimonas ginsengisoli]AIE86192.1 Threonine dehydrogenase-related Zn-dependent dehydrogenase [Fimbriimonas ginsengisoli Gsoil 348]